MTSVIYSKKLRGTFFCDNYSLLHFNKFLGTQEPEVWKEVYVEMNRGDCKCCG